MGITPVRGHQLNPFLVAQSGAIQHHHHTTDGDASHDRPSYATSSSLASNVSRPVGAFDTFRNQGRLSSPTILAMGRQAVAVKPRVSRSFGIGPKLHQQLAKRRWRPPQGGGLAACGGGLARPAEWVEWVALAAAVEAVVVEVVWPRRRQRSQHKPQITRLNFLRRL